MQWSELRRLNKLDSNKSERHSWSMSWRINLEESLKYIQMKMLASETNNGIFGSAYLLS